MATYAPIPTGYVDDGPLGALWAGQNASAQRQQNEMANLADMMDLMTKGQTYDQTERMDPLRVDALRGSNRTTDLANTLSAYQLPSKQRQADADLATLEAQFKFPGFFEGQVAGSAGLSRKNVVEADIAEQTKAGRILGDNVANRKKELDAVDDMLPSMVNMSELQMAEHFQKLGVRPEIARGYLDNIRASGGIKKVVDNMSRTPAAAAAERLQAQKDAADLKRANISAGAQISAAEKNAQAAISAGNKNALAAVLGQTKSLSDQLKMQLSAIADSMDNYKPEDKKSAEFKSMVAAKRVLEDRLEESNRLVEYVTANIVGYAPPPNTKAPINTGRQGKEGVNPTSSGTISNAPASTKPPAVIKLD